MRYEDIAQDGSLKVCAMPAAIGLVPMSKLWFRTETSRGLRAQGILPILTRLIMQATGGPISVRNKVEVDGAYQLGHSADERGAVARIYVNAHVELYAPVARTHPPQPDNAGARVHVGRVFAEHVFTRPFAPPSQRKVLALPGEREPHVPADVLAGRGPLDTLVVSPTRWLDDALTPDPIAVSFGLTHTDSNQHVNSLVYPHLFGEAALRRLYDLGHDTSTLLVEHVDVAFRKPCFAGERMHLSLRAFEQQGQLGAIGTLGPQGSTPDKAHSMCWLRFR